MVLSTEIDRLYVVLLQRLATIRLRRHNQTRYPSSLEILLKTKKTGNSQASYLQFCMSKALVATCTVQLSELTKARHICFSLPSPCFLLLFDLRVLLLALVPKLNRLFPTDRSLIVRHSLYVLGAQHMPQSSNCCANLPTVIMLISRQTTRMLFSNLYDGNKGEKPLLICHRLELSQNYSLTLYISAQYSNECGFDTSYIKHTTSALNS